jgi:hypothetical protein
LGFKGGELVCSSTEVISIPLPFPELLVNMDSYKPYQNKPSLSLFFVCRSLVALLGVSNSLVELAPTIGVKILAANFKATA